jgi:outer membrane protein OmpA-like peptidoglycan-associated protein
MSFRLTEFLDFLRSGISGFETGDEQHLAALFLLEGIAARGQTPRAPSGWRTILAPVLCSSPAQQELFYQLFDQWLANPPEPPPPPPPPPPPEGNGDAKALKRFDRLRWWIAASVVVIFGVLGYRGYQGWKQIHSVPGTNLPHQKQNLPNQLVNTGSNCATPGCASDAPQITFTIHDAQNRPVAGATVYYAGNRALTTADGAVTLDRNRNPDSHYLLIIMAGYLPALSQIKKQNQTITVASLPAGQLEPVWRSILIAHALLARFLVLFSLGIGVLLWMIHLLRRRLELKKWAGPLEERMRSLSASIASHKVFRASDIRALATGLRRRRHEESPDLDVAGTIERTARNAGLFTPAYARRTAEPDYLFLGERMNLRDHQARLHDELVARLRDHDVKLQRFYFQSDPRICTDSKGTPLPLSEIVAAFSDHEVWLAIDSDRCMNVITGLPHRWWSTLERWHDRTLLTSSPPDTVLEVRAVAPTRSGIASLIEEGPEQPELRSQFPALLRPGAQEWLDRSGPPPALLARLIAQLQLYLGPQGYLLLQACAVYPAIAWNITITLAENLLPAAARDLSLERLVALPWFRHGMMPDWLRVRLVSRLGDREVEVRSAIRRYLDTPTRSGSLKEETLDIVPGKPRARRRLSAPLQDHVYLSFAQGRKLDKLSVEAPPRWRQFLRDSILLRAAAGALVLGLTWFATGQMIARLHLNTLPFKPGSYADLLYQVATAEEGRQAQGGLQAILSNSQIVADLLDKQDPIHLTSERVNIDGASLINAAQRSPAAGMIAIGYVASPGQASSEHDELIKNVRGKELQFFGVRTKPLSNDLEFLDLANVQPAPRLPTQQITPTPLTPVASVQPNPAITNPSTRPTPVTTFPAVEAKSLFDYLPIPATCAGTPTTQTLCSISFDKDRNRPARVDGEAKACLDEVALSLQNQSDDNLYVVGYADSGESDPNGLAAARAANTKEYLVVEKGIDASRIKTVWNLNAVGKEVHNYLVSCGATATAPAPTTTVPAPTVAPTGGTYTSVQTAPLTGDASSSAAKLPAGLMSLNRKFTAVPSENSVSIWSVADVKVIASWQIGGPIVAFSWDGSSQRFAYAESNSASVNIWDISKNRLSKLAGASGRVTALDWSPDDKIIAAAVDGGYVLFYDVTQGREIESSKLPDHAVPGYSDVIILDWHTGILTAGYGDGIKVEVSTPQSPQK